MYDQPTAWKQARHDVALCLVLVVLLLLPACGCCCQVGTIQSPALVKALFDIYLGRDAVSADAKKSFGSGLAALLAEK